MKINSSNFILRVCQKVDEVIESYQIDVDIEDISKYKAYIQRGVSYN
jgi:glycerol-3-phosphate cytidylyltransferase-like family protein